MEMSFHLAGLDENAALCVKGAAGAVQLGHLSKRPNAQHRIHRGQWGFSLKKGGINKLVTLKKREHNNPLQENKPRKVELRGHNNSCRAETL